VIQTQKLMISLSLVYAISVVHGFHLHVFDLGIWIGHVVGVCVRK